MISESINVVPACKQIYGSMVCVFETGVLVLGKSGIGKSETLLELITRGHSLVADDAVLVTKLPETRLSGTAPDITARMLEIRGLGIIHVVDIFGEEAYTATKELSLCVELRTPEDFEDGHGLDVSPEFTDILEVNIPKFVLPVRRGRNIPVLIETAVKMQRAPRSAGQIAGELMDRYDRSLRDASSDKS